MAKFKIDSWKTKIPDETFDYLSNAFPERCLSTGKYTFELERRLSKLHSDNYVVCVNSGTSALKCLALYLFAEQSYYLFLTLSYLH